MMAENQNVDRTPFSPFDLQIIKGRIPAVKPVNSLTNRRAKRSLVEMLFRVPGTPVDYGRNSTDILYR